MLLHNNPVHERSLIIGVLDVLACSRALRARVLTCLRANVIFTCSRANLRARVLFTCPRAHLRAFSADLLPMYFFVL